MSVSTENIRQVLDGRFNEMVEASRLSAQELIHEWDKRALEWPLNEQSTVVEVGGYVGRFALQIAQRFNPQLYVFEPQGWAYEICVEVMKPYTNAKVHNYALGTLDGTMTMGNYGTDGCSFVDNTNDKAVPEQMREIGTVFAELGITHVDLMLINVEGYEYILLKHMLTQKLLPDRLLVQFHTVYDEDGVMRESLTKQLSKHYNVAWDYGVVLKAWVKKGLK